MISARGLSKNFDGFTALDGVSLELGDNEILGVIGHNGAGKTTLLKIMTGLIPPTRGSLSINGIDVVDDPVGLKKILGYLPEDSHLYETMTVRSYLTFFGEIYGMEGAAIREKTDALLGTLQLDAGEKKIGELSKGMKRKVAIARSLLHDPGVLIYDEPSSGLDPMTSRTIIEFLKDLRKQRKTIVFSAHNLYQVEEICDRVMILRRGREVACGSIRELREMFGSITYTLTFSIGDLSRLGNHRTYRKDGTFYAVDGLDIDGMNELSLALPGAGGRVERVESHHPTLEQMLVKIGN
ncbi:MAG: ABC transporter ATP-binding protein [Methanomicrobiales archaeon]|nr:ABC transporter ATP-binding protein [Methanomicrobiales archaeon]MDD1669608.1 ABC transporter ATP-binding protein [Methanomicrobiales archaeon]